ncbi:hypothetical protein F4813DRAFT_389983 [Daldinia decipiens]|uniref:uncharacterized protein n=1 Tax=Daldinia decipiens TaxID=326647 RepID=UPI0020C51153|nr:uncharacterized protein F4813DRAFT_389983 [Daldinia decipiens]KAI1657015.1 hypothetical protein F4813DRAFT_389983 [Daldinia decipiens]
MGIHCSPQSNIYCPPTRQDIPIAANVILIDVTLIDVTLIAANRPPPNNDGMRTIENSKMGIGYSLLDRIHSIYAQTSPGHLPLARRVGPPKLVKIGPLRHADDELISNWLSGVSYSNCPNEETSLTGQTTPVSSPDAPDSGGKVDVGPSFTCPSIVLQPPKQTRSIAQSGTGLDGPLSSEGDKLSKLLRGGLNDLKESSRSAHLSGGSQKLESNTSGSIDWEKS